ncbi:MAG: Gfo/Idh/MocA family protein [Armatimonadota bacterium]
MASDAVRIGFVGAGGIAQAHMSALKALPEAKIVAVCDVNEERARAAAAPFDAAVYTNGADLIANEEIDALYVCVPPNAHGDIEVRAAQRGLHLFVEKPISLYMDEALRAWDAIRAAGIMTQVGYVLRYWPGSVQLKEFLADKEVGTANVFRWGGIPGAPWWRRMDESGGQLVEMTTHQVDLLRWVMGEVTAVSAGYSVNRLLKDMPDVTVPDSQAALLFFESGATATVSTSCALGSVGSSGMYFVIRNARVSWEGERITVDPGDAYPVPEPKPSIGIDEAFVRAVATGDRSLLRSTYDDALRTLAVTLAANRSAEEGGRLVHVDELLTRGFA